MTDLRVVVRVVGIVLEALLVTRVPVLAVVVLEAAWVVVLEVARVVVLLAPPPLVTLEGVAGGMEALEFVREIAGIESIIDFT